MKIKNGKVKLEAGEIRLGNFFIKEEKEHLKVTDLNAVFSFRINKGIPVGLFLAQAVDAIRKGEKDHERGIGSWIAVLWSVLCTVPDKEFLETAYLATEDCMKRHPEAYGMKGDASEEEQEKAEGEVREMMDFEEEVKNIRDDGSAEARQ